MSFLIKLETLINNLMFKCGAWIIKILPAGLKRSIHQLLSLYRRLVDTLKALPLKVKSLLIATFNRLKQKATALDVKTKLQASYARFRELNQTRNSSKRLGQMKTLLMTPFALLGQWLQSLSTGQTILLLTFSAGSFLSVLGIYFSGQRLADSSSMARRTPASEAHEVVYERPQYYKKQTRHFGLVNFRLPVYVADINEIKSVDIDFTATLSNRYSKKFLEKNEFQLRDFIILQMEPTVAHFPLKEEGKEIIRKKIWQEINNFLVQNKVEGEVTELKIVYVLAN